MRRFAPSHQTSMVQLDGGACRPPEVAAWGKRIAAFPCRFTPGCAKPAALLRSFARVLHAISARKPAVQRPLIPEACTGCLDASGHGLRGARHSFYLLSRTGGWLELSMAFGDLRLGTCVVCARPIPPVIDCVLSSMPAAQFGWGLRSRFLVMRAAGQRPADLIAPC